MQKPAKPKQSKGSKPLKRLPYVNEIGGYLYYRRKGRRVARLPSPEGSYAFLMAYKKAEEEFLGGKVVASTHTVDAAITLYLSSADYKALTPMTRSNYRRVLDLFRMSFGDLDMADIDAPWIEKLRDKYAGAPNQWNDLRSRMSQVTRRFRKAFPKALPNNPWADSDRRSIAPSDAHKPWPPEVLTAVMGATTPEFRALLTGYLLTAQRGGDVTKMRRDQYDSRTRTLKVEQGKTGQVLLLHVPDSLAETFQQMQGRHAHLLFTSPRGKPWKLPNAQETLKRILHNLGLPRYTLHGLRATGPVALKMLGFENRVIRSLTGHTSDKNLEVYLRGVPHYAMAKEAQEALHTAFSGLLTGAGASGHTGQASRSKKFLSAESGKEVANAKFGSEPKG